MTRPLRVLLADDHAIVRQGLKLLIDSQPDMAVVGESADGNGVLDRATALKPDIIVMDLSMPGMNGLVATRTIVGCGSSQWNPSQCASRERRLRVGSTCSRAAYIMRPKGTCDGQTSSQARHTRQRSMKSANVVSTSAPAATARMAAMRPRGEADSSPVRR